MNCPNDNELAEFVAGVLDAPAVESIDEHLDACAECTILLASFARDPDFDSTADGSADPTSELPVASAIDGRYVFLEIVGTGSMGVVYAAYDRELDRKVAIKVLRSTSESDGASARLLREAKAMARLSHPNIVPVYDVGTISGRVFVVMEFVAGQSMAEWLGQPRTWREVAELFRQAGRGLAASHDAGFVHRDIKPGNMLIGEDGRVRIADFGVASDGDIEPAVAADRPANLAFTRTGELVGTPAYMAPELFADGAADPRSDQFSFSVALYEALYGARPFPAHSLDELVAAVSTGRPTAPPAGTDVPSWLHRAVTRGLERQPSGRHRSMTALVGALSEPTRPRRRLLVPALVAVALVGSGVTALQLKGSGSDDRCQGRAGDLVGVWDDATRRQMADALAKDPRRYVVNLAPLLRERLDRYASAWIAMGIESCEATYETGTQSERLLDLRTQCLDRRLSELSATTQILRSPPSPDVFEQAVQMVDGLSPLSHCADADALTAVTPLPEQPAARRRVVRARTELDQVRALNRSGQYEQGLEQARALADSVEGLDHAPTHAAIALAIGKLESKTGQPKLGEASLRRAASLAADAKDDALAADAWTALAWSVGVTQARIEDGLALAPVAEAAVRRAGSKPTARAFLMSVRGSILNLGGKLDEAKAQFERAIEIETEIESPDLRDNLNNLAAVLHRQGALDEARDSAARALKLAEETLGEEHPELAKYLNNLGSVLMDAGKLAEARPHLERALAIREAGLRPNHARTGESLTSLGALLAQLGETQRAQKLLARAVVAAETSFGPLHPSVAVALNRLGNLHYEADQLDEARAAHRRSVEVFEKALGEEHANVSYSLQSLAAIAEDQQRFADAEKHYARAYAIRVKALGDKHPHTFSPLNNLGGLLLKQGKPAEALAYFERAAVGWEKILGPDDAQLAHALVGIGESQLRLRRTALAISPLERAVTIRTAAKVDPLQLAEAQFPLARALWNKGAKARALSLAEKARALLSATPADKRSALEKDTLRDIQAWLRGKR